jgi:hypothetical protein
MSWPYGPGPGRAGLAHLTALGAVEVESSELEELKTEPNSFDFLRFGLVSYQNPIFSNPLTPLAS